MKVIYEVMSYRPALVTGKYVRYEGDHIFHVFERATCWDRESPFYGKPGMGRTLRGYLTDGADLPEELRTRCIETKQLEEWE